MSKYSINEPDMNGRVWIEDMENGKVFNGYDFMGSVIWEDYGGDAYWADPDEAEQIVADLEAADEPAEPEEDPAKKEYLLKTVCEDIKQASIKTGKQIADIYEMDQLCGIYSSIDVYDLDTLKEISLLDLVEPILENKRWMEREYRDYCKNEAYGDY